MDERPIDIAAQGIRAVMLIEARNAAACAEAALAALEAAGFVFTKEDPVAKARERVAKTIQDVVGYTHVNNALDVLDDALLAHPDDLRLLLGENAA